MRFPKQRIRFATVHEGHTAPDGYLVLDLKGLDTEGATSFVLDMRDVDAARAQGDKQSDAARRVRDLFGA
jgi:hypothetical protein